MEMHMKMNISQMLKKKKKLRKKHYTSNPTEIRYSIKFYNNFKEINILEPYIFFSFS